MRPIKKKTTDEQTAKELHAQIAEFEGWDAVFKSVHGKFLVSQLEIAINETLDEEDTKNIYQMDQQAREYFFASVRSKRQTLKAIKKKLITAEEEKAWRIVELQKVIPKEE